jgi:hypothetical protein
VCVNVGGIKFPVFLELASHRVAARPWARLQLCRGCVWMRSRCVRFSIDPQRCSATEVAPEALLALLQGPAAGVGQAPAAEDLRPAVAPRQRRPGLGHACGRAVFDLPLKVPPPCC